MEREVPQVTSSEKAHKLIISRVLHHVLTIEPHFKVPVIWHMKWMMDYDRFTDLKV
jgi:hypothetical protein